MKILKYLDLNQTKFKNLYEQCYDYFDQSDKSTELEKIVLVNMINNKQRHTQICNKIDLRTE